MKKTVLFIMALLLSVGAKAQDLWTGSFATGNWTGGITIEKEDFASVAEGNIIKITISGYDTDNATYWQYALKQKDNSWVNLPDFTNGNITQDAENACYRLTADDVTALKTYGLAVQGHYITITKVELLTTIGSVTLYSDGTGVSTGNYENVLDLAWSNKGDFSTALMKDFIAVTYNATGDGEVRVANPEGWQAYTSSSQRYVPDGNSGVFVFAISSATILEGIQQKGAIVYGKNITITKVELLNGNGRYDAVPVVISSEGIATYSHAKSLNFNGTGITPYYASAANEGTITLSSINETGKENTTSAYTGYIIKGSAGTYDIPVTDDAYYPSTNYLVDTNTGSAKVFRSAYSSYVFTEGDFWYKDEADKTAKIERIKTKYRYIFAKNKTGEANVGFYKLTTDHTLGAHKAYLETDNDLTTGSSPAIAIIFDDEETTGVNEVRSTNFTNNTNEYFNLAGQRVANPTKGLYIVNGKKVIIK